jgi:hypothetical protein
MDPFIEARGLWGDFHHKLIGEIERAVSGLLPPRYAARVRERTYIDWIDPQEGTVESRWIEPDVKVRGASDDPINPQLSGNPASDPSNGTVVMHALAEVEQRELYLEIIELDPSKRLVTCIEILSPTNKSYGGPGWKEYERKRQVFLTGRAHLVEIDLLRGGRRRTMVERWPDSPYYILVMRKESAPQCCVSPAYSTRPLPSVSIPLAAPDADLVVPLQPFVDAIFVRSRYAAELAYDRPLTPPLGPAEQQFLAKK